jgi:hypothetical protein
MRGLDPRIHLFSQKCASRRSRSKNGVALLAYGIAVKPGNDGGEA